eukprot:TRINITY_DN83528_c0_g1_i1.p1 TRINITY_DN83528_c0_g1~~TRINITY_DN83528_c0_g1_i1.p1  ORF type:complete len:370 (-),score=28.57 TRINITY_DN83528_c0_g1_i1:371-1480(-)
MIKCLYSRRSLRRASSPVLVGLVAVVLLLAVVAYGIGSTAACYSSPRGAYRLHASRAALHLCNVPEAGALMPNGVPGPGLPKQLQSVSFLGRSLGGVFWISWDESPWGPFVQVGLLSGLVTAAGAWSMWASHVFVDSEEAAADGRALWGLPTSRSQVGIEEADAKGEIRAYGKAPLVHFGDGMGPLGRIDSPAKVIVGAMPWSGAPPLAASEETEWARQLREDRVLRGDTGLGPALAKKLYRRDVAVDDGGDVAGLGSSKSTNRVQGRTSGKEGPLPWPLPRELLLSNLCGCLQDNGRPSGKMDVASKDTGRLLRYNAQLKPRTARTLPGRCPTGGSGLVPRVDFSDWQPVLGYEFLDIDADLCLPEST